jgi:hypothetical protein
MTFPFQFPFQFPDQTPPALAPPDTDQYIYRYVTKFRNQEVISELTQIAITQP